MKVAVFPFPPAIFVDEADGKVKGFYVDMLREVASREHWELQFVHGTWADGLERARKDEVDLLTSVAFTPERGTFLDYGQEPSFTVWSLLYAHPKAGIQSILDLKDRSVAVMRNDANGANFRKLSTQFGIPITFLELESFVEVMKAVESRQVEAGVTPNSFGYFSEHNYRAVRTPVVVNPFPIYFAVSKGKNADLLSALDRFLAENRGTPQSRQGQIVDRWLNPSHGESLSPWVMRGFLLALALLGLSLGAVVVFRRQVRRATREIRDLNHDLRRELETRLASEENLAITLHSIGDAVIATDTDGLITRMNSTAERLTGWPLAEALGQPLTQVFHIANALTREQSEDPVQKVLTHGEVVGLANHTVLLARDGQEYQIADSAAPIRDAAGSIIGVVLVFSDVTEEYRVEEALAQTTEMLKNASELAKVGGWELELPSMKLTWSLGTYHLHELDPTTPVDVANGIHFYAPEAQPVIAAAVQAAIETGTPYDLELPLLTAKGRAFWARAQCTPVTENGRVIKLVGAFQDITERKQAAEELRLSEVRFRAFVTTSSDVLYRMSPDWREMLQLDGRGFIVDTLKPRDTWVQEYIHPEDQPHVWAVINEAIRTKSVFELVHRVRRVDGTKGWTFSRAIPLFDSNGEIVEWFGVAKDVTERRLAEDSLRQLTEDLKESQRIAKVGSWRLDLMTNHVVWSDELYRMYGFDPTLPPPPYSEHRKLFTLESWDRLSTALANTVETGSPYEIELETFREGMSNGWMWAYGNTVQDANGINVGLVGAAQDITERKQVELELERSHALLTNLASLVPGVVYQYRLFPDGRSAFPYSSPGMNDIYEVAPEEVRVDATPVFGRLHPDDYDSVADAIKNSALTLEEFHSEFRVILPRQGLRWRWSEAHPQRMEDGSTLWHGIILDITERKQAETALRKISMAVEQSPVSIVITDTNGNIEYVNPKFTEITGYAFEEILGVNPRFLKSEESSPETYGALWKTILSGETWRGEFHNRKKNGELFWEQASISPIKDAQDRIIGFVAVKEDITELRNTEKARLELQKQVLHNDRVESLGVLAGGIAHDFNNILTAIVGNTELALHRLDAVSPLRKNMESIELAGRRAKDLVQKILLFSRKVETIKEPVVVASAIEEALKLLRSVIPSTITVRLEVNTAEAAVLMDPTGLNQVLMNLCVNAAHAMRKSIIGTLTLSAHRLSRNNNNWIEVSVRDTGSGIPPEIRSRIFDPFFTTKGVDEGTGMGLSVVHGIIAHAGGSIEVESEVGSGTCFRVLLPEVRPAASNNAIQDLPVDAVNLSGHLLLVDDELPIREMLSQVLTTAGCTVVACADGEEALQAFLANPAAFEAVLCDQTMPRMTGLQLAQEVVRLQPALPFILMTGVAADLDPAAMKAAGAPTILSKPLLPSAVIRALRPLLVSTQKKRGV
ncbi:MAG: PAS domain S-box protein [Deltaproteobacteria bacterium]|nr:PAS domain S-box protein [Deltaproteobacteria bacterium]